MEKCNVSKQRNVSGWISQVDICINRQIKKQHVLYHFIQISSFHTIYKHLIDFVLNVWILCLNAKPNLQIPKLPINLSLHTAVGKRV